MGESSDGDDGVFHRLPTMFLNIGILEFHSVESSALFPVLLVLVMLIGGGLGDSRLLSSNVEPCRQDGESKLELRCLTKLLLQLSIIHGKGTRSDTMETFVTHVQESGGASKALDVPYRITVYKSDVYAQYPISYVQSFNENPHEVAISSPHCRDGENDKNPDCGWPYDNDGEKVKDSQGFCCMNDIEMDLPDWQQKNKSLRMVAEDCNVTLTTRRLFPWRSGSAHCLRFSQKWYPTYQFGKPILSIYVRVVVEMMHLRPGQLYGSQEMQTQTIHLNLQQSTQVHPDGLLKAHLGKDFEFNISVPVLQDQYLSIPMEEGKSEKVSDADQWLTLPKDYFTLDSKGCDKIGISHSAFKSQAEACDQPFQSCCGNQLNGFVQEDSQRMLAGKAPKYAFSQYGKAFVQDVIPFGPATLNLHIEEEKVSIVTVELQAGDLQYYHDRSTGKILKADVERFETGTRRLLLLVEVVNLGIMKSYFKIKVVDCTARVDILPAEITTLLVPAIASSFWLNLRIREDVYSFNSNTMSCKVVLFDNLQETPRKVERLFEISLLGHYIAKHVEEPKKIKFSLFNISWCFIWCNDTSSNQYRKPPPPPPRIDPCLGNCTELFDAVCFVQNWCWQKFLKMIGIIIAILVGMFIVFLLFRSGAMSLAWETFSVCIGRTTKKATKVGQKVKQAQKKRQKKRKREDLRAEKDKARDEFLDDKLMDDQDEQFDKIVLGIKKGKKGKKGGEENGKKSSEEKGKKSGKKVGKGGKKAPKNGTGGGGKAKRKGKTGGKGKQRKRKRKKKEEHSSDSDEKRKKKRVEHSDSDEKRKKKRVGRSDSDEKRKKKRVEHSDSDEHGDNSNDGSGDESEDHSK